LDIAEDLGQRPAGGVGEVALLLELLGNLNLVVVHQILVHHHDHRLIESQRLQDAPGTCKTPKKKTKKKKKMAIRPGVHNPTKESQRGSLGCQTSRQSKAGDGELDSEPA